MVRRISLFGWGNFSWVEFGCPCTCFRVPLDSSVFFGFILVFGRSRRHMTLGFVNFRYPSMCLRDSREPYFKSSFFDY
jgi:hypothetical protein